jgi:predicted RND superfamily exporter protein
MWETLVFEIIKGLAVAAVIGIFPACVSAFFFLHKINSGVKKAIEGIEELKKEVKLILGEKVGWQTLERIEKNLITANSSGPLNSLGQAMKIEREAERGYPRRMSN